MVSWALRPSESADAVANAPRGTGKNWHAPKKAFRPTAGLTSYAKRVEARKHDEAVKEREREMKEEKEAERKVSPVR